MKKVLLTKTNKAVTCAVKITSPDNTSNVAYGELFRALLRIPEKDIQHRILDAINGKTSPTQIIHAMCPNCKATFDGPSSAKRHIDASTQTDSTSPDMHITTLLSKDACLNEQNSNIGSDDSRDLSSPASVIVANKTVPIKSHSTNGIEATKEPVKRKRKRKVCLPQVVKRSHAQLAQSQLQPKMKKQKVETPGSNANSNPQVNSGIDERRNSFALNLPDNLLDEIINMPSPATVPQKSQEEYINRVMAIECLDSTTRIDGLLPIHRAVIDSEIYTLRRQIFVWKMFNKQDLNDLLTDDDESCLQLAIVNDSFPKIIEVLLESGLNVNETDNQSNNCIHLAILNEIEVKSLEILMQHIDLSILLQLNDDGYTPLHMAVRNDSFRRAEVIFTVLDQRLGSKSVYSRAAANANNKNDFSKYYEQACKNLKVTYGNATSGTAMPKLKKRLLECGDRKSGNTALFFAIENKLEHFVYLLLAHLTDPRVQNFNGQDAKSYYSEFGKSLNLSLKVDNAMENVINLID